MRGSLGRAALLLAAAVSACDAAPDPGAAAKAHMRATAGAGSTAVVSAPAVSPVVGPAASPAVPSPAAASAPDPAALLAARAPSIPVGGAAATSLHDTYIDRRGTGRHGAIDIAAARGTPVFAVDDGVLVKLFTSVPGGLTVYQFDPSRRLAYYYAHLDSYADGVREGMALRRCQLIGYVGSTGNAAPDAPHLHFAVFALGPQAQWWKGEPVNPYPALVAPAPLRPACG